MMGFFSWSACGASGDLTSAASGRSMSSGEVGEEARGDRSGIATFQCEAGQAICRDGGARRLSRLCCLRGDPAAELAMVLSDIGGGGSG